LSGCNSVTAQRRQRWAGEASRQNHSSVVEGGLMAKGHTHEETGAAGSNGLLLVVVIIVLVIAVVLLQRTASTAIAINSKASTIAKTGVGINENTDSILELSHTNQLATSILNSAQPLQNDLSQIVTLGDSVNGLATTINQSAQTINGTANQINSTAGAVNSTANGINSTAGSILSTANSIKSGVAMINQQLDTTIPIVQQIKGDTAVIVSGLATALKRAGCINHDLGGNSGTTC
jgi:methyl-accepting chemotaxis protein